MIISACDVGVCVVAYDPHCGTDGRPYDNLCSLKQAKCNRPQLDVAYKGLCLGNLGCQKGHSNLQCVHKLNKRFSINTLVRICHFEGEKCL